MTIKLPQKTLVDKFLMLFGKKRGVILPDENQRIGIQDVYLKARWENFWIVFFRLKKLPFPEGVIDLDELLKNGVD